MTAKRTLTRNEKFNAIQSAVHAAGFVEEKIKFKIIEVIDGQDCCRTLVELENGDISAIFVQALSGRNALHEAAGIFGNCLEEPEDYPWLQLELIKTSKGQSIYKLKCAD